MSLKMCSPFITSDSLKQRMCLLLDWLPFNFRPIIEYFSHSLPPIYYNSIYKGWYFPLRIMLYAKFKFHFVKIILDMNQLNAMYFKVLLLLRLCDPL